MLLVAHRRLVNGITVLAAVAAVLTGSAYQAQGQADAKAADSKTLYSRYCSLCHGDQCQGAMGTPLQNMTMDDKQAIAVTEKGDGKQMPAFGKELTIAQITGLIAYIHTFDTRKPG